MIDTGFAITGGLENDSRVEVMPDDESDGLVISVDDGDGGTAEVVLHPSEVYLLTLAMSALSR